MDNDYMFVKDFPVGTIFKYNIRHPGIYVDYVVTNPEISLLTCLHQETGKPVRTKTITRLIKDNYRVILPSPAKEIEWE